MLALRVDGEECGCERGVGDIRAVFASVDGALYSAVGVAGSMITTADYAPGATTVFA